MENTRYSIEDFQIIRVIGKGYMGKVMIVREKAKNSIFAIKSIHKNFILERREVNHTRSERDILADLVSQQRASPSHFPFLIKLHAAFQDRSNVYYLMDFHEGGDMAGLLAQLVTLPENWVRFYASEIVLALNELHQRGIVYRDLKPENILISGQGNLILTDFGLSKFIDDGVTKTFCGTPEYLAPELVLRRPYGKEIDWWSLGALIYEMLTPFWSDEPSKMYYQIIQNKPPIYPPSLSKEAKDILTGLLSKDPSNRFGFNEIISHPFFDGLDWDKIIKLEYQAPFIPSALKRNSYDLFDPAFTNMPPIITPDNENNSELIAGSAFKGFSFRHNFNAKPLE